MGIHRSDGEQTRGRLLTAAGEVFAAKGFHDATTAEICRRAGANAAAVHYHFRSKERLYVEAWRHAFDRSIRTNPPDGGVAAEAPPEARLQGQIRALVHRMLDPGSIEFDIGHKEMANPTGLLAEVIRRAIDPLHRRFTETVGELLGPSAPPDQVRLCAMSVLAQCSTLLVHERPRRGSAGQAKRRGLCRLAVGPDTLADHIYRFSLAGITGLRAPRNRRSRGTAGKEKTR